jgi:hypothetical protein
MDLMIDSLGFRIGSQGSFRLSGLIYSDPSADKSAASTTSGIPSAEREGDFADLLDEVSYDLKIEGAPDLPF